MLIVSERHKIFVLNMVGGKEVFLYFSSSKFMHAHPVENAVSNSPSLFTC